MGAQMCSGRWYRLAFAGAMIFGAGGAFAGTASSFAGLASCDQGPVRSIPLREPAAATGSQFAQRVRDLSGVERDRLIQAELLAGNVPDFLRHLVPVSVGASDSTRRVRITVCVLPDYLALGSDADFVLVPMGLRAALEVASHFGFVLPTPKLVDAIYSQAPVKLEPKPLPASDAMRSTLYFVYHNELISRERIAQAAPLGELTSGDKKDLVLTSLLWVHPGRVAIYGWHRATDEPIQPLSTVHGARYADYSHGVRLISSAVYVDGVRRSLEEVLADPALARSLTRDGPLPRLGEHLRSLMAQLAAADDSPAIVEARLMGATGSHY